MVVTKTSISHAQPNFTQSSKFGFRRNRRLLQICGGLLLCLYLIQQHLQRRKDAASIEKDGDLTECDAATEFERYCMRINWAGPRHRETRREHEALVRATSNGQFPIPALMRSAKRKWKNMADRQSANYAAAVIEYRRRYARAPPNGFREWFAWARENNVKMIDEYDQIDRDLRPFWALEYTDFKQRLKRSSEDDMVLNMKLTNGVAHLTGKRAEMDSHGPRYESLHLQVLRKFAKMPALEGLEIPFNLHDGPRLRAEYNVINSLRHATLDPSVPLQARMSNGHLAGWNKVCSPLSRLVMPSNHSSLSPFLSDLAGGLIYDHRQAMDVCAQPELLHEHGYYLTNTNGDTHELRPFFSQSKTISDLDILVPTHDYLDDADTYMTTHDPGWHSKRTAKLFWRGGSTGIHHGHQFHWWFSQRLRLHQYFRQKASATVNFLYLNIRGKAEKVRANAQTMAKLYTDIGVTNAVQCSEEDGVCDELVRFIGKFADRVSREEANDYRYLLDLDGNAWSGRFPRLLASTSVAFKATIYPEYYQDYLIPWYHYVPIRFDYSDIYTTLAYFNGDKNGRGHHLEEARLIGEQGREWVQNHMRRVDIEAYLYRLYLEWARLLKPDRESASEQ